jgi:predicted ATPase
LLLKFAVSNHRSVFDRVELSMIAVDADRAAARRIEGIGESVLATAGIYGANASGKSNVLGALAWLSRAVSNSLRLWEKEVPRDPFKFGSGPTVPSIYEVELDVAGVRYAYHLEVDDSQVLSEVLYNYPERRPRALFRRNGLEVQFRRGLGNLAGTRELLTPTTLALSAAARLEDTEVGAFAQRLSSFRIVSAPRGRWNRPLDVVTGETQRLFEEPDAQPSLFPPDEHAEPLNLRESALALLRFADLGIDDVQVVESEQSPDLPAVLRREGRRRSLLLHHAAGQELGFPLAQESAGTQTWFSIIGPTLSALQGGRVLLFDEIDSSLHPRLSARLIELFQDPVTNPRGAQLIFTSHDTSLLNQLNRDEVWLTERDDKGMTSLTALAEFGGDKVRRSLNLESAYLRGRFGAVPELDQFLLRQALGLLVGES